MTQELRSVLKSELSRRISRNPRYSLRSFSNFLGVSPAYLSRIISGDRQISKAVLDKILDKLAIDSLVASRSRVAIAERTVELKYRQLEATQTRIISEWFHYAILALLDLPEFKNDPKWISSRLNITVTQATKALEDLLCLGIIEEDSAGSLVVTGEKFVTTMGSVDTAEHLKQLQKRFLEFSTDALTKVPISRRSHSGVTFALDEALIPEMKKKIDRFRRHLHRYSEKNSKKKTSVYQFSLSLFPLSDLQ